MKYGSKTDKWFEVRLTGEENERIKKLIKNLGISRREFLLTKAKDYVFLQDKNKKRLLRKKLRAYTKATQRLGKRRISYLLRQVCGETETDKAIGKKSTN